MRGTGTAAALLAVFVLGACGDAPPTQPESPAEAPEEQAPRQPVHAVEAPEAAAPHQAPPLPAPRAGIELRAPRGPLRREDMQTYEIGVQDLELPGRSLVFQLGDDTLWQRPFEPTSHTVVGRLPAEVVRVLRVGDVVTWGIAPPHDADKDVQDQPVVASFERAPDHAPATPGTPAWPAIDPRQPDALRDLAARVGLSVPSRVLPLPNALGDGRHEAMELWFPRGRVLRSGLAWMGIGIPEYWPACTLTFTRDGTVLHTMTSTGEDLRGLTYLPEEVISVVRPGDQVTWTLAPPQDGPPPVTASFQVIEDGAAEATVEALRLDARLGHQSHWVRRALQCEAYLARDLVSDALQCALLTVVAFEGPIVPRMLRESPTFFRLEPFFPPVPAWQPAGFEASLAARSAVACLEVLGLVGSERCIQTMDDLVWIPAEEVAARAAALQPLVGDALDDLAFARLHGPGRQDPRLWGPVRRGLVLDELLALGGAPLARFLDVERELEGWGESRTLPPPESLAVPTGPAREVLEHALRHARCGRHADALDELRTWPGAPDSLLSYRVHAERGRALARLDDATGALAAYLEAARVAAALPWPPGAQDALAGAEHAAVVLGDYERIVDVVERRIAIEERAGQPERALMRRSDLGVVAYQRGQLGDALLLLREAHAGCAGQPTWSETQARIGLNLGAALVDIGAWPEALATVHAAYDTLATSFRPGAKSLAALTLGVAYTRLGAFPQAEATLDEADGLATHERDAVGRAYVLANRANARAAQGRHDEARALYHEAIEAFAALGDARLGARLRCALGDLLLREGRHAEALETSRTAADLAEAAADEEAAIMARANEGEALAGLGQRDAALATLEAALARARAHDIVPLVVEQEARIARVLLVAGRASEALTRVRTAFVERDRMVRGLGTSVGPAALERTALMAAVGIEAASEAGGVEGLFEMLERTRAQALAEGLLGRDANRTVQVDPALRRQAREARQALREADEALAASRARGDAGELRRGEAARAFAERNHRLLAERIADAESAGVPTARPTTLELAGVQGLLADDEVLVLYGVTTRRVLALVIEPGAVRRADLGSRDAFESTCARLIRQGQRSGARGAADDEEASEVGIEDDPIAAAQVLHTQVVAPLRLGGPVRRVIVSPVGVLGYVPFGLLLPDHVVTCVPSASTLAFLRARTAPRGHSVLALGDPDYVGGTAASRRNVQARAGQATLAPLPGTRREAAAIGDVTLLGDQATKEHLVEALQAQARWRAVHLGCHGLVDAERPTFCALALAPGANDDGMLTTLDVLRLPLAADLVTLSACDTGRGRFYKSEGIVGLTHAFLMAGAPCVLVSQWKADDDATCALMIRFHELWNPHDGSPGLDAATALRQAQAHVRAQPQWAHPYYWASWVLWGDPR